MNFSAIQPKIFQSVLFQGHAEINLQGIGYFPVFPDQYITLKQEPEYHASLRL
jgi:hypothetical protein